MAIEVTTEYEGVAEDIESATNISPSTITDRASILKRDDGTSYPLKVEGIASFGHDLFLRSGIEGGFGDNSDHGHFLIDIDQAEQSDQWQVSRFQQMYRARSTANLRNGMQAFFGTNVSGTSFAAAPQLDVSASTIDASAFTSHPDRGVDQVRRDVSGVVVQITGHGLSVGDLIRFSVNPSFAAAMVAGSILGVVTEFTASQITLNLFQANLKTTTEAPAGEAANHTAISSNFTIQAVPASQRVNGGNETTVTAITLPDRERTEHAVVSWSSEHGLQVNQPFTIVTTNPNGGILSTTNGYVIDEEYNGSPDKALVALNILHEANVISGNLAAGEWSMYRGVTDGLHRQTAGNQFFTQFVDSNGIPVNVAIGAGAVADGKHVAAIGMGVYNKDPETVVIGFKDHTIKIGKNGEGTALTLKKSDGTDATLTGDQVVAAFGVDGVNRYSVFPTPTVRDNTILIEDHADAGITDTNYSWFTDASGGTYWAQS